MPVFVDSDPYKPIEGGGELPELVDDPRHPGKKVMLATDGETYAHGFVILELNDDDGTAKASYYQETEPANAMYTETF